MSAGQVPGWPLNKSPVVVSCTVRVTVKLPCALHGMFSAEGFALVAGSVVGFQVRVKVFVHSLIGGVSYQVALASLLDHVTVWGEVGTVTPIFRENRYPLEVSDSAPVYQPIPLHW